MRIAVSGSHGTGKSTLVAELIRILESHHAVDEPYFLLEDEGHVFEQPPSIDDFHTLLHRAAVELQHERSRRVVFDRSPIDYLAYMAVLDAASVEEHDREVVHAAVATLDLIVFVPVEDPDRLRGVEFARLRRRVDDMMRDMLLGGAWGFDVPVLEVEGSPEARAAQVAARLDATRATGADLGSDERG